MVFDWQACPWRWQSSSGHGSTHFHHFIRLYFVLFFQPLYVVWQIFQNGYWKLMIQEQVGWMSSPIFWGFWNPIKIENPFSLDRTEHVGLLSSVGWVLVSWHSLKCKKVSRSNSSPSDGQVVSIDKKLVWEVCWWIEGLARICRVFGYSECGWYSEVKFVTVWQYNKPITRCDLCLFYFIQIYLI